MYRCQEEIRRRGVPLQSAQGLKDSRIRILYAPEKNPCCRLEEEEPNIYCIAIQPDIHHDLSIKLAGSNIFSLVIAFWDNFHRHRHRHRHGIRRIFDSMEKSVFPDICLCIYTYICMYGFIYYIFIEIHSITPKTWQYQHKLVDLLRLNNMLINISNIIIFIVIIFIIIVVRKLNN